MCHISVAEFLMEHAVAECERRGAGGLRDQLALDGQRRAALGRLCSAPFGTRCGALKRLLLRIVLRGLLKTAACFARLGALPAGRGVARAKALHGIEARGA